MEQVIFYLDWLYQSDCFPMIICRARIYDSGLLLQQEELRFCLFYLVEFYVRLLLLKVWKPLPSLHLLYFLLRPFEGRIYFRFIFLTPHYLVQGVAGVDTQTFLVGWMKELSSRVYGLMQLYFTDTTIQLPQSDPWPIWDWMLSLTSPSLSALGYINSWHFLLHKLLSLLSL